MTFEELKELSAKDPELRVDFGSTDMIVVNGGLVSYNMITFENDFNRLTEVGELAKNSVNKYCDSEFRGFIKNVRPSTEEEIKSIMLNSTVIENWRGNIAVKNLRYKVCKYRISKKPH